MVRLQGVVLKSMDLGENDKIVTIFTDKLGKIDAVAHGVRKAKSKQASSILPFCYGEYVVYKGQSLYTISQTEIRESFQEIIMDLDYVSYGSYFLELFDVLNEKECPNVSMLSLLLKTLYVMVNSEVKLPLLRLVVDFKAVSIAGYLPRVGICGGCRERTAAGYFSIENGGIYCSRCRPQSFCYNINEENMELLVAIKNIKFEKITNIIYKQENIEYLQNIMTHYIMYHTDRELKSIGFINQINK
jgi:DNA repair protein RecO (recombination protein O)